MPRDAVNEFNRVLPLGSGRGGNLVGGLLQAFLSVAIAISAWGQANLIELRVDEPGVAISSNLFGIFFEEINSAGDGGLYGELVRNRSFEDSATVAEHWTLVTSGSATGEMAVDTSQPLSARNGQSLRLTMQGGPGSVGVVNGGWWGIGIQQGAIYDLTFYARVGPGLSAGLLASLENADGSVTYAQAGVSPVLGTWRKFDLALTSNATDPSARLRIRLSQPGSVWLDMLSLFPRDTYRGRTNGLRADLAGMLADLQPAFMRFPGGCWVEGETMATSYRWKATIGDPADRANVWNLWGYYSPNGLGYHEYLQLCEDLGAEAMFVINAGMSHNGVVPLEEMGPYVQDALDAIEYAVGPTNTAWGAMRASNGHPEPFRLRYLEVGNENGGTAYNERYALFYDAVKLRYPDISLIANVWGGVPTSRPVEMIDEHYYSNPAFFIQNANRYDSYSRLGPKVYVGEYAVTSGAGNGNLAAALGEAAFMTGMERNSDVVELASYAPLFTHVSNRRWNPDLICFDSSRAYGTPSYYVQQLFSQHRGERVLHAKVRVEDSSSGKFGQVGVATWNTQAAFSNVVVTAGGETLYQSDFSHGLAGWRTLGGTWSTAGGVLQQTAGGVDLRAVTGSLAWTNYTLSLRAKKTGGAEGFLILFHVGDDRNWTWWNIGGWNNTVHALERMDNGMKRTISPSVAGQVMDGRWYDIQVTVEGSRIQCYLDGQLVHDVQYPGTRRGAVGIGTWNTQSAYSNVVVSALGQTLVQSDFVEGTAGWQFQGGTWEAVDGVLRQTASGTTPRALTGDTNWAEYSYTLRAQKLGGSEGFLILFHVQDSQNWTWWNIGGWNNTQHAIERMENGVKSLVGSAVSGSVTAGRWYEIRIDIGGPRIRCYLDGALIHDINDPVLPALHTSASYDSRVGQVILKAVNVSGQALTTGLKLQSLRALVPTGQAIVLTGDPGAENSLSSPRRVSPLTNMVAGVSSEFTYSFPANSLTVMRLQIKPDPTVTASLGLTNVQQTMAALSNGVPVRLSSFITNSITVGYVLEGPVGVLQTGSLQFWPGMLEQMLKLELPSAAGAEIIRLKLLEGAGVEAGEPSQIYFVRELNSSQEPPRLGYARFPGETLLFWTDAAADLLEAPSVTGTWAEVPNAVSPLRVDFSGANRFYRLRR